MTRSALWYGRICSQFNLSVNLCCDIKFPEIIQFVVFVILSTENISFTSMNDRRVWCTNAWLGWTVLPNLLPVKWITSFGCNIAFVDSWSFNKTSENKEWGVVNLWKWQIISWLWDFTCLLNFRPVALWWVEFKGFWEVL